MKIAHAASRIDSGHMQRFLDFDFRTLYCAKRSSERCCMLGGKSTLPLTSTVMSHLEESLSISIDFSVSDSARRGDEDRGGRKEGDEEGGRSERLD